MKRLQHIALGFLVASMLLHVLVVLDLLVTPFAEWPRLLWILHAGIPLCFIPAVVMMSKRLSAEGREGHGSIRISKLHDLVPGADQRYALVFCLYGTILFYLDISRDPTGDVDNWLFLTLSWMGIYYLTWHLLRREIRAEN